MRAGIPKAFKYRNLLHRYLLNIGGFMEELGPARRLVAALTLGELVVSHQKRH